MKQLYNKLYQFTVKYLPYKAKIRAFYHLALRIKVVYLAEGFQGIRRRVQNRIQEMKPQSSQPLPKTGIIEQTWKQYQTQEKTSSFWVPVIHLKKRLILPNHNHPLVTIIVVATGAHTAYRCLSALPHTTDGREIEVVVIDNGTSDETAHILSRAMGIQVIRYHERVSVAASWSQGVAKSQGEFLLFLRDEVVLQPRSLDKMLETYIDKKECGMVGVKLVSPDGVLREAGCTFRDDDGAEQDGHGDNPQNPFHSYLKASDYCTSAILVKRDVYDQSGGFDVSFDECAEADFALTLRQIAKKTYYQPLASAIIFKDNTQNYDERNCLVHKWQNRFTEESQSGIRHRQPRVLVLDNFTPTPDRDSGSVDAVNHMRIFQDLGFQVTFIPTINLDAVEKYTASLQQMGIECLYQPFLESIDKYLSLHGDKFDMVVLARMFNAVTYIDVVRRRCPQAKVIFNTVDLHYLREIRRAEIEQSEELKCMALETKKVELSVMKQVDMTLVISQKEEQMLKAELPDVNIFRYSLIIDIQNKQPVSFDKRRDVFFLGGFRHLPNVDAVCHFAAEIWPRIRERVPGIKFYIVGSDPPEKILDLAANDIVVVGFVDDQHLSEFFNQCRLSIAPLRYGAGIKGKVGRSLGYGLPVVATSMAVEGTGLVHDKNVLIADGNEAFAEAVLRLYNDENLWNAISRNSLVFFEENYSYDAGKNRFHELIQTMKYRNLHPASIEMKIDKISSYAEYKEHLTRMTDEYAQRGQTEMMQIGLEPGFTTNGYCYVCGAYVSFHTTFTHASKNDQQRLIPNWREHMVCPKCSLNNRMRATIHVFERICNPQLGDAIYLTEQTTPIFSWFKHHYYNITGSEYLGERVPFGRPDRNGIRNETLTNLTFGNELFNFIISLEVFEHIPDYEQALQECLRCLKPGGSLIFTVPFLRESPTTVIRARILPGGEIKHILPPEFHGDPIGNAGILCYYHFGWDLLDKLRDLGFASASANAFWSDIYGYLGIEHMLFIARKRL